MAIGTQGAFAQSKMMRNLSEQYEEAFSMVFYHSTLNMMNVDEDPEFSALIKDLEKIKLIRLDKDKFDFSDAMMVELKDEIIDEEYEELMTVRHDGSDVKVYIKERKGVTTGLFMYMDEINDFTAFDITGSVPLKQLTNLISKVQGEF